MKDILFELQTEKVPNSHILQVLENVLSESLLIYYYQDSNVLIKQFNFSELKISLFTEFWLAYQSKMTELAVYGDGICKNLERSIILINIDRIWREHLQKITLLREAVGWRGYGQSNPLYEYKEDAFYIFETRNEVLRYLVIYDLLRSSIL